MSRASTVVCAALVASAIALSGMWASAEPEGYTLDVRLRHRDGTRITGGRVTVLGPDADTGPPFAFRTTSEVDAKGNATFHLPKPGRYDLEAIAPEHRSVSSKVDVKDSKFPLVFELVWASTPVMQVTVEVKDPDGAPIEDARVQVTRERRPDDEVKPPVHDATTDATGTALLHVSGVGSWSLTIRHPRYESETLGFDLAEDDVAFAFATNLERKAGEKSDERKLRIRVLDGATSTPVAGAAVEMRLPGGVVRATSDEEGVAVVAAVVSGRFEIAVTRDGYAPATATIDPTLADGHTGALESTVRLVRGSPPVVSDEGGRERPPTTRLPTPPGMGGDPQDPAVPPADFSGRWRHVSGTTLELVQSGATVTGRWSHLDSRLTGTVRGKTLEFTTTSPQGLDCEGQVTLDAAGRAFFGEARVTRSASDGGKKFHFDAERVP